MIAPEIKKMYDVLVAFLGESKNPLDETLQLQFQCPRCSERGEHTFRKYHLEVNLANGFFNCWKCSSIDAGMHGSVYKLIKRYGNEEYLKAYKDAIESFRSSSLFKIHYNDNEFQLEEEKQAKIDFPKGYTKFVKGVNDKSNAFQYLKSRGIGWDIITDYKIGFTTKLQDDYTNSHRIILPSFDRYGELNYWTGRDYTNNTRKSRYNNTKADRKNIIFNEEKVEWNADITLVEGPFDSIVVPNSIPLLGKGLTEDFYLYKMLNENAHANINIMLDNDAIETAKVIYKTLDKGRLKNRIRFIEIPKTKEDLDPSKIYQLYGGKGIARFLSKGRKINEIEFILNKSWK